MITKITKSESLMNSKKELEGKVKKLERKNQLGEEKRKKIQIDLQTARKACRYYQSRCRVLEKSRDNWKGKHKYKQQKIKHLKEQVDRRSRIKFHHFPRFLILLCIFMRIKAGCSYEGIVKVLQGLELSGLLGLVRLPCANSIQNWVSKVGLFSLMKEDKNLRGREVSLIIDESIRMGQEKQLLILSVPWVKEKKEALSFEDVEVLYIEGSKSWTGVKIAHRISELEKKHGFIFKSLLSDQDSKLRKAARLSEVAHLPDISHAVATCLRKTFAKAPDYKGFTTLVAGYQSKGVNQDISYFMPSKQRAKARFMNQGKLVHWGKRMLARLDQLEEKAQKFFVQLPKHEPVIKQLDRTISLAKTISLAFKIKGLSTQTLKQAQEIVDTEKQDSEPVTRFLGHIKGYLAQYKQILTGVGKIAIHASSEIIESFFGKYKSKAHGHVLTGITKLNLEVPLYAMTYQELNRKISLALEEIKMTELDQWVKTHSAENQLLKRIKFFKK